MGIKFTTVQPEYKLEPKRDPMDSDRAHAAYCIMSRIAAECQAYQVVDTGNPMDPPQIVEDDHEADEDHWSGLVDMNTAGIIVQIADKLNAENRMRFLNQIIPRMAQTAWSLAGV